MAKSDLKLLYTITERLPVVLTRDELLDRGQRLAQCDADLASHMSYEESIKKDLKAKSTKIEAERSRLANVVRQKAELRDVQCDVLGYFEENVVRTTRKDNGEVTSERAMTLDERQEALDLEKPNGKKGKKDDEARPT